MRQVGLLAIELQLCIRQPEKALGIIACLEDLIVHGPNIKPLLKLSKMNDKEVREKRVYIYSNIVVSFINFV